MSKPSRPNSVAMLVDSHCHLDFPDFAEERDAVVARAGAAGVGMMVTISTRVKRFDAIRAIAEAYDNVFCSVGTHPHNASEETDIATEELVKLSAHPKVVAIGEAGLDYFYDRSPRDVQAAVFRRHIAAARQTGLPLVIHSRDADSDMETILRDEAGKGAFPFILHCFSSGVALARAGVELGGYVSFSGILTFKKSEELRAIARASRMTVCWSRPTRRIWRRCRSGASATNRPMSPIRRRCWRRRSAWGPTRSPR
jgi:TatD DNase family protein